VEKHSILINVFGRQFPASVDAEEKVVIEEAARTVNAKIKAFRAQYKTQDDLDIAIMCCLDIMTEYLKDRTQSAQKVETALQQLSRLEQQLDAPVP